MNKLIDADNRRVVIRGERGWREDKESKGDQIYCDRRRLVFGW